MNKKDLFFTYILAFICIACCFTFHYPKPWHFPFMIFALLLGLPFLLLKNTSKESNITWKSNNNTINNIIAFNNQYPLTFFYIIVTLFALLLTIWNYTEGNKFLNEKTCGRCRITTVKTLEKASIIQTFLAKQNCLTEHEAMHNEKGEIIGYTIKLKNSIRRKDYDNAISELLDTSIIDKSVEYPISSTYYRIKIDKPEGNKFRFIFKTYSPK